MPFIKIEAGVVNKEQKEKLIKEITKAASRILDVKEAAFYVLVKENSTDNWGVGGKVLTDLLQNK